MIPKKTGEYVRLLAILVVKNDSRSFHLSSRFITRAGLPAAKVHSGMSFVTTDPAPITALSPIRVPPVIVTLDAMKTPLPIEIGLLSIDPCLSIPNCVMS